MQDLGSAPHRYCKYLISQHADDLRGQNESCLKIFRLMNRVVLPFQQIVQTKQVSHHVPPKQIKRLFLTLKAIFHSIAVLELSLASHEFRRGIVDVQISIFLST